MHRMKDQQTLAEEKLVMANRGDAPPHKETKVEGIGGPPNQMKNTLQSGASDD